MEVIQNQLSNFKWFGVSPNIFYFILEQSNRYYDQIHKIHMYIHVNIKYAQKCTYTYKWKLRKLRIVN